MFLGVFLKINPVLGLVFLLMVVFNIVLSPERINKYVGKASGLKGWLLAILSGVFATGPIYTWYILLGELKQQGMKTSLIAAFLYSRAVKLPLLPLLVHYFGFVYTLVLSIYLIVFSIVSGVIVGKLTSESTTNGKMNS